MIKTFIASHPINKSNTMMTIQNKTIKIVYKQMNEYLGL